MSKRPFLVAGLLALAVLLSATGAMAAGPAPPIWAPQADGTMTGLKALRGNVVFVDFWASWCAPCRESLPQLDGWHRELGGRGFSVLAVNVDTEQRKSLAFLKQKPVSYPVVYDPEGVWPEQYAIKGMPSAFLVDRQGRIHASYHGYKEKDLPRIRRQIEALLAETRRESR
jgi:thiol-disulfide isomerase/thioredoxin